MVETQIIHLHHGIGKCSVRVRICDLLRPVTRMCYRHFANVDCDMVFSLDVIQSTGRLELLPKNIKKATPSFTWVYDFDYFLTYTIEIVIYHRILTKETCNISIIFSSKCHRRCHTLNFKDIQSYYCLLQLWYVECMEIVCQLHS